MSQKRAMAIHDISCVGRCSLTVALPILSAAGVDTGLLPTALLSTHTAGFENYTYLDMTEEMPKIAKHWKSLDLRFDAIYSGFLGSVEQVGIIEDVFDDFRLKDNLIVVDPVMADGGKFYPIFDMSMAVGMRRLCRRADLIIPNLTEAAFLLDEPYVGEDYNEQSIREMLKRLTDLGCPQAMLTGVSFAEERLGAACYDARTDEFAYCDGTLIHQMIHGTGDVFGSALVAALMNDKALPEAMGVAVDYTHVCIEATVAEGKEFRYGPCFEVATGYLLKRIGIE